MRRLVPHITLRHKNAHVGKCEQNQSLLSPFKCLSASSDTELTTTPLINIKLVVNFNMTHDLHEFVPTFNLYLIIENAQNPARKHFEKTYITIRNRSTNCATVFIIQQKFETYILKIKNISSQKLSSMTVNFFTSITSAQPQEMEGGTFCLGVEQPQGESEGSRNQLA